MSRARAPAGARRRPLVIAASALVALAVLVFGIGQLILPSIAARVIRDSIAGGEGVQVSVSATPAVKLLFGSADRVTVRMQRLQSAQSNDASLIAQAGAAHDLDASIGELRTNGLLLSNVSLRKRGSEMSATATVNRSVVAAMLPLNLRLAAQPGTADGIVATGSFQLLGATSTVNAVVAAVGGRIVLSPDLPALGRLVNLTIFSAPAFWFDSVTSSGIGDSYVIRVSGHYL